MKIISLLRSLVIKNWPAKLVCFLFAVGLWGWVVVQQTTERSFAVEINFHEMPEEHVIAEKTDREVMVTLRGPQAFINTLESDDIAVDVNLSGLSAGDERIQILPWHVQNPEGTDVAEINPRSIQVTFLERISKIVDIRPGFTGERLEEYDYDINVYPDTALVSGPREQVETLSELYLTRVDLPNADDPPVEANVAAVLPRGIQLEVPDQNVFQVKIAVQEVQVMRVIENVPVRVRDLEETDNISLDPESLEIEISGPASLIRELEPEDIDVVVDAPEEGVEFQLKRVDFTLPEGIELTDESAAGTAIRVQRGED